ncbi:MAG: Eco57I restriction-modification methylase domain-containing protein [Cyanobacteria bacterium MAG CAR4_bin_6]|nr:Eco57I restriction-modification methylase domain-containing protein [Cyanobacteria bacterium MAG CAR4_bin_6]
MGENSGAGAMVTHTHGLPHGAPDPPWGKTGGGRLFSRSFLSGELKHTQPWQTLDHQQLASVKAKLASIVSGGGLESRGAGADSGALIRPVLRCLGWEEGQGLVVFKTTAWHADPDQGHDRQPAPAAAMVAELRQGGRPRWGILTNGNCWRLYDGQARSVAQGFLEVQLLRALKQPQLLERFVVFFRPQALGPRQGGPCWLQTALTAHGRHQERIATAFQQQACHQVFPTLATAVARAAPTVSAAVVQEASLVLLYRLLFLLYGESRGLPGSGTGGNCSSLHGLVNRVAETWPGGPMASREQHNHWTTIAALFRDMARRQPHLGRPGQGIFSAERAPLLAAVSCSDETVASVLMGLCFTRQGKPIDYADLAIEQLGALYEQLMAYRLKRDGDRITVAANRLSRKAASCYYTPRALVDLVLRETIAPLVQGLSFRQLLNLKICDPAMGTGNFLLGLLDYLGDAVLAASASSHPSPVDNGQTVRSLVLQHCIYGVDKDPMAVDLARMALMLHGDSPDPGHLDHHLHWGNSLFGCWIRDAVETIRHAEGCATLQTLLQSRRSPAAAIAATDPTTLPNATSHDHWHALGKANGPLAALLSAVHAGHWLEPTPAQDRCLVHDLWGGRWGNPVHVVTGVVPVTDPRLVRILDRMNAVIIEERFFHWQLACPGLWPAGDGEDHSGGFDAVIGNPPWDRVKLQQVEWFAQNCPDVAWAPHAAARRQRIAQLQHLQAPQAVAYAHAAAHAAATARVAKSCGDYPLLSGGDLNLYALFVERAMALVKPHGLVGMVTPSSLVSGKTGAGFFRRVVQEGRLKVLYDFENRKTFFPDVHGSLRFCVFVARKNPGASSSPVVAAARCAFRLGSIAELKDPERRFLLGADDFARVNPNTRTAPLFRSRRDAGITTGIYRRLPVLVNRSGGRVCRPWPVTYRRMFDMSADSHLFRSTPEGGDWLPLYEGKMMQAFDHRAADVVVSKSNVFRPARQRLLQNSEKASPERRPRWRHYVKVDARRWFWPDSWVVAFKDVTATTNMRTMVAAILPRAAVSHKLPLLLFNSNISRRASWACFILANLNSIVFDFVVRQKLYGTSLTLHVLEQLPVVPPDGFHIRIGSTTAAKIIRAAVLELTYTAWDLAAFARDLGHGGPPFVWNPQRRLHLRARLDALFFLLYGITDEEEIHYIYSTFPVMQRQELALYGDHRSVKVCLKVLRTFQRLGHGPLAPAPDLSN